MKSFEISFPSFLGGLQHIMMHRNVVQDATEGHSNLSSTLVPITITPRAGAASWLIVDLFSVPPPAKLEKELL